MTVPIYTPRAPHGHTEQEEVNAMVRANRDRDRLARLVREAKVSRRDDEYVITHPDTARVFIADITRRAFADRQRGMDTIRPNKRRAKTRKRR